MVDETHPGAWGWPTRCHVGKYRVCGVVGGIGETGHVKAVDRKRRNDQVVALWLSGASYRAVARAVGLRSPQSVHNIVQRVLAGSSQRRDLLTDEAFAVWQERTERLFQAHWARALDGNYRSSEVCRKILGHQATVYGLAQGGSLPGGTRSDAVELKADDAGMDELAKLRAARAWAYG
jgi:hypothetical protein